MYDRYREGKKLFEKESIMGGKKEKKVEYICIYVYI